MGLLCLKNLIYYVFFFDPAFRSKLSWDYQQWACCVRCVRMVVPLFWCLGGDIYARARVPLWSRQQVKVRALVCRSRHYFPRTITSIIYALWTVRVHTHRTTLYRCTPGMVDVTRNWQKRNFNVLHFASDVIKKEQIVTQILYGVYIISWNTGVRLSCKFSRASWPSDYMNCLFTYFHVCLF